jgi:hypothetical protein
MSLSGQGLLRWYAACCRTPLGNTPRNHKIAYVGLLPSCLPIPADELDREFGPSKIALNTDSAYSPVRATPLTTVFGIVRIMKNVVGARWSGRYRNNSFFHAESGKPILQPQVLSPAKRHAMDFRN